MTFFVKKKSFFLKGSFFGEREFFMQLKKLSQMTFAKGGVAVPGVFEILALS